MREQQELLRAALDRAAELELTPDARARRMIQSYISFARAQGKSNQQIRTEIEEYIAQLEREAKAGLS